ncbi:hypothetical protein [Streptomyces sp. CNZ748]|uniref:hypothetical protein n=1 Tax=Streptomyces sp. CNZ748 TaxID=2885160 RepID=UPI001E62B110|nr:hypothetical protein [Streptomyces sp. CNZ748]
MAIALIVALMRSSDGDAAHATQQRRAYLRYLTDTRRQAHRTALLQREAQLWLHPEPSELRAVIARRGQLWERTQEDPDFVQVRVGTGKQSLATPLVAPAIPAGCDRVCADGLTSLMQEYGTLEELPLAVSLRAFHHIHVCGTNEERIRNLVRSMVAQLVTLHGPDGFRVMVYAPAARSDEWEWIDYLPHAGPLPEADLPALVTGLADDTTSFTQLLAGVRGRDPFSIDGFEGSPRCPHVLVVCDTLPIPTEAEWLLSEGRMGVTLIRLVPDTQAGTAVALEFTVTDEDLRLEIPSGSSYVGEPDALMTRQAIRLARDLSRFRLADDETVSGQGGQN